MTDVLYSGSGVLPSGASDGSGVEQLNNEVCSSGSLDSDTLNNFNDEQATTIQDTSGSVNVSIPETQDVQTSLIYDSGSVNGLTTFNNNFVTISFVVIILLSAIFGTLLFSLLKDFFR